MPDRLTNLFRIRDYLGSPMPSAPDFHQILRTEIAEEQDMLNELSDTSKPWATLEWSFNYQCGRDSYAINAPNWGKPILVVRATCDCNIPYVPVPFDDLPQRRFGKILAGFYGQCGYQWLWDNETIEHISFYRAGILDAQPMLKVSPMPSQSVEYIITYVPGYLGDSDSLSSSPTLPEHTELLRLRAATALLPYSRWQEDEAENRIRRKELAEAFAYQLQRRERNYREYVATISHSRDAWVEHWN